MSTLMDSIATRAPAARVTASDRGNAGHTERPCAREAPALLPNPCWVKIRETAHLSPAVHSIAPFKWAR